MSKEIDAEAVKSIISAKVGDAIILKDMITYQHCGGEFNGVITDIHKWDTGDGVIYYGVEVEPNEETTLLVLVRVSNDGKDILVRLYRKYIESLACDLDVPIIQDQSKLEDDDFDLTFGSFAINPDDDDQSIEYGIVRPTPFFMTKKIDGDAVAICEYKPININYSEDEYNSAFGFCEWYAYNGNGTEGLVTLWLGWKISSDEFEIYNIKK